MKGAISGTTLAVADAYNGQGLGSRLMLQIIDVARSRGLAEIEGLVLTHNDNMLRLMRNLGFHVGAFPEDPEFRLVTTNSLAAVAAAALGAATAPSAASACITR